MWVFCSCCWPSVLQLVFFLLLRSSPEKDKWWEIDCAVVDCGVRNLHCPKAFQESLVLLLFFVGRPCCGGLFFLFYLRTWVQQQRQLESAATLKGPREEQQLSERFRSLCLPLLLFLLLPCHIGFLLFTFSLAVGGVWFSCRLRSLWLERYLLCSAKKRKEGRPYFSRQTGERESSTIH